MAAPNDSARKAPPPLELRHLSATKLLDPSDLRLSTELDIDGDMGNENIPNYDDEWSDDLSGGRGVPAAAEVHGGGYDDGFQDGLTEREGHAGDSVKSERKPSLSTSSPLANPSGDDNPLNDTTQTDKQRSSSPNSKPRNSFSHKHSYSEKPVNDIANNPENPPSYRPQIGPVAYKQLQLDDEHEEHDIVIHQESDLDIHSPNIDEPDSYSWGRGRRAAAGGWFYQKWRGALEMMCMAVPCSQPQ
ncbi:hypothetical protein DFS34DRAFT_615748 [Phlyctochytrium arcticum]|nr:hypothetical protein DFS34DRAFT_615748 [Phlyctochytrium arcticum]